MTETVGQQQPQPQDQQEQEQQQPEAQTNESVQYSSSIDVEVIQNKVDEYDINSAIADLSEIINKSSEMYYELKKIKFEYLSQAFELYSRIDVPSLMMINLDQAIKNDVPKPTKVDQLSTEMFRQSHNAA